MTTHTGYVMTLANSIIGVSLLAMPYCFKQCGLILGTLLILASNVTTRLACHFLVKSAVMCRRKSFEYVAYHAFGSSGKLLVELGVIGFMLGTSVAFFVVMGDLAPAILSKILLVDNDNYLRTWVLLVMGILVVLPLSLLRNIGSLAAISTVTMVFYMLLVLKLLTESFPHLAAASWPSKVNYWRPEGVLQCFPIFAMALSCQTQVFEILEVLPNPTLERMNDVVRAAVGLCTGLYLAVGFLGYVAYSREPFGGNILLSFSPSTNSDLFQLGFVVSIALSFPIVVFPCRASLNSLLFKKGSQYQELTMQGSYITDGKFKLLTCGIVGVALATGLIIPNIEFVLGFVGSTIGVAICVMFPAAAFIHISSKKTSERLIAKVIFCLGLVVMILGVYGNLDAVADRKNEPIPAPVPVLDSPAPPVLQQLPKSEKVSKVEEKKKAFVEKIEPQLAATKQEKPVMRQEPPIPVEPVIEPAKKSEQIVSPSPEVLSKPPAPGTISKSDDDSKVAETINLEVPSDKKAAPSPKKIEEASAVQPKVVDSGSKKEVINEDAIAREEMQLKEDDAIKRKEEEFREQELLKKLQEHQEQQKQLLKEQQNILDEIKSRDPDPRGKKLVAQKPEAVETPVEPIAPQKFNDNIEKIQVVIEDLKERKQVLDKTKGERIAEEKKKNAEKKKNESVVQSFQVFISTEKSPKLLEVVLTSNQSSKYVDANIGVDPLLLNQKNVDRAGRDILAMKPDDDRGKESPAVTTEPVNNRGKRDVDEAGGSCSKTKELNDLDGSTDRRPSIDDPSLGPEIKQSKVVSSPVTNNLNPVPIDVTRNIADTKTLKLQREETRKRRRK